MELLYSSMALAKYRTLLDKNKIIGFVPTMGALHRGHLSLVEKAKTESNLVIVSIFVNPTQFNDPHDLKNYPKTQEEDISLLETLKTDAVFLPEVVDIYPTRDTRIFNFGNLDKVMEGRFRPGHFNGVAQVITKLFDLVKPHKAFFGQKDFQQLAIIKKLVEMQNYPVEIVPCPTVREPDGLAMSSRNSLLTEEERIHAPLISKTLFAAREKKNTYSLPNLKKWVIETINSDPFLEVEYFEIVNSETLNPVNFWNDPGQKTGCIAVKIGKIRLIDNVNF